MQAYLKSELRFRGVQAAGQRDVVRVVLREHPPRGFDAWRDTVLALWRARVSARSVTWSSD